MCSKSAEKKTMVKKVTETKHVRKETPKPHDIPHHRNTKLYLWAEIGKHTNRRTSAEL